MLHIRTTNLGVVGSNPSRRAISEKRENFGRSFVEAVGYCTRQDGLRAGDADFLISDADLSHDKPNVSLFEVPEDRF